MINLPISSVWRIDGGRDAYHIVMGRKDFSKCKKNAGLSGKNSRALLRKRRR